MKNSRLTVVIFLFISCHIFPQQVIGKLVDEDQTGLSGIDLKLYIHPNVYNTTTSTNGSFSFTITEVKDEQLPTGYAISNNFPNPFNPKTRIGITLPNSGEVKIEVFNLLGQMVADAIEKSLEAGTNFMDVELNGLPNGMYFLRMKIDNKYNVVKKVMLIYGSQHLSVMDGVSNAQLNKNTNYNFSVQNTIIDSLVATSPIIGRKIFTNLPNITGNLLDLGNLIIERYCPETPTVLYAGKIYKTVKIGSQCWLKENLDVGIMIDSLQNASNNITIEKYCFGNNPDNCNTYGGLYQWNEAMMYSTIPGGQGICPAGWHIPTYTELQTLVNTTSDNSNVLKAIGQGIGVGAGTNISGFSALLAGLRYDYGNFNDLGYFTGFWSSMVANYTNANFMGFYGSHSYIYFYNNYYNDWGFSVRCLKD